MTASSTTVAASTGQRHRFAFGSYMVAEWTKIRSVRSTLWTLILFVVITVGLTAGLTTLMVVNWAGPHAADRDAHIISDPVGFILGVGIGLGQLTICVLGALAITTEYSTGVIRSSFLAVPKRIAMLAAKSVVLAVLLLVVTEAVAFGSYFAGAAILHSKLTVSLSDPGVTRAVTGAGLYLTVLGLFAMAIGGLIRNTAGAIATVIGVVLVLPIVSGFLPGSWGAHINAYLPEQAGSLVFQSNPIAGSLLSAWQGFGIFCAWTALLMIAAGFLLVRRDA